MAALDQFIASFNRFGGPAHLNKFEVVIDAPFFDSAARHVSFRVEDVTMPGKNIRTTSNDNIYGPSHEMAQGLTYAEEINMTILLSAEHFEKHFVHLWMDFIVKPNTYDLEYYQSYTKPLFVYQLDKNGEERVAGARLNEAFPKTIGPINYSQTNGELARQEVSFAFKDVEYINRTGYSISRRDPAAGRYPRQMQIPVTPVPYNDAILRMAQKRAGLPRPPIVPASDPYAETRTRNPHYDTPSVPQKKSGNLNVKNGATEYTGDKYADF